MLQARRSQNKIRHKSLHPYPKNDQPYMTRDWIIELTEELSHETEVCPDEAEHWKNISIYKIPVHAVNLNKEAYIPWVAAIGPYHHDDEQVQRMEGHKRRALRFFLRRSKIPLKCYVDALAEVVHYLMDAYAHLDEAWKKDTKKFVQLMIIDGCFILEIMRVYDKNMNDTNINDYSTHDFIFSNHGKHNVIPCIRRDMLLLENQVPLLVLVRLLAVESGSIENSEKHVIGLILKFYGRNSNLRLERCQHVLHVFRESLLRDVQKDKHTPTRKVPIDEGTVHSATEMKEAGIKFQKGSGKSLKGISFKGRTLTLPTISLDDTSESTFLNMVAYERLHVGAHNEISTYIYFMNRLVSNERDVHLLKSRGIISNSMGSDEDVTKLFLTLSKEILLDSDSWLDKVYIDINEKLKNHFRKTLYRWRYHFIHIYFRSPWAIFSVMAAALGLGLSITQVIYAVLSFVHRNHG